MVAIDDLHPNPFNTNVVGPENQEKLDASIRRHGFFKPVVVREIEKDGIIVREIIGGEHRWDSARRLGMTQIPISNLGEISDDKAKEIMLADNARYGSDDTLMLAELMEGMDHVDEFTLFLPMIETDLKSIFAASNIALDALDVSEEEAETVDPAEKPEKTVKTHTVMKFKVPVKDAEKITDYVTKIQTRHGYTTSDELSNAGDALVHILFEKMA